MIPWAIDHKGPSLPWLVSRRLIHDQDRVVVLVGVSTEPQGSF